MLENQIDELLDRENICWAMAGVFLANRDAHGVMDMGAELQALQTAGRELCKAMSDMEQTARDDADGRPLSRYEQAEHAADERWSDRNEP
jgi:hypothetical protein